jgi:hypothetical protein
METFTLKIHKFHIVATYVVPILFFISYIIAFVDLWVERSFLHNAVLFLVWPMIILNWKRYLRKPVTITVSNDTAILHDVFGKETVIPFSDFRSIEVNKGKQLKIVTLSDEILGVQAFDGFNKFVEAVKRHDTALHTTGC